MAVRDAAAQQPSRRPRIGVLWSGQDAEDQAPYREPLLAGFAELGHRIGQTIVLAERFAGGQAERFDADAQDLVATRPDVIVAVSIACALAAQRATRTIPVVFLPPSDPVGLGLVRSLSHPGGNLTGISSIAYDLEAKRLQILRECIPGVARLALLTDGLAPQSVLAETQRVAAAAGLASEVFLAPSRDRIEPAMRGIAQGRMDAVLMPAARRILFNAKAEVARSALQWKLPLFAPAEYFTQDGALMSYGPNYSWMFRRVAWYVDRILAGARPADLPVEQPSRLELWINQRTAAALGIEIPTGVLARADRVLE